MLKKNPKQKTKIDTISQVLEHALTEVGKEGIDKVIEKKKSDVQPMVGH